MTDEYDIGRISEFGDDDARHDAMADLLRERNDAESRNNELQERIATLTAEREKVRELVEAVLAFRDWSRKVSSNDLAAGYQGGAVQAYHAAKKAMIDLAQLHKS